MKSLTLLSSAPQIDPKNPKLLNQGLIQNAPFAKWGFLLQKPWALSYDPIYVIASQHLTNPEGEIVRPFEIKLSLPYAVEMESENGVKSWGVIVENSDATNTIKIELYDKRAAFEFAKEAHIENIKGTLKALGS